MRTELAGVALERYLLRKHAILRLHVVDQGSERYNLGVLLVSVSPSAICHHVAMHLV